MRYSIGSLHITSIDILEHWQRLQLA